MLDSPASIRKLPFLPITDAQRIRSIRNFSPVRAIAMLCITIGLTTGSIAQNAVPANKSEKECEHAATTSAMRACENFHYNTAQRELNDEYQSLMRHLDISQRRKLQAAQRAWLRFRDTNTEFQASLAQGGTLAPLIKIVSLTEMTQARASELKKSSLP